MTEASRDFFGPGSNQERRIVRNYDELTKMVNACKALQFRIGLIQGTYDLLHEGHVRYLEIGKKKCDILIIGVDSDAKVRKSKGENRPIDLETSRMEMLCHVRHVDLVFLKGVDDVKWQLIKTVHPDVLIATEETYDDEEKAQLKELCGELMILPRQAATSTTARVRRLLMESNGKLSEKFESFATEFRGLLSDLGMKKKGDE